jgi:hypothetical protein
VASDFALTNQLYCFMEAVPLLWSWDKLKVQAATRQTHAEQRGPMSGFLQFEFFVLEEGVKNGEQYIHISVSVTDPSRPVTQRGGSVIPLSTSFLIFENGEVDMPLAREIYDRTF